jgi:hypothetical protein
MPFDTNDCEPSHPMSDLEFWAFLAVAITGVFLPFIIVRRKGRPILPASLLSLMFWPGALSWRDGCGDDGICNLTIRLRRDILFFGTPGEIWQL